MNIIITGGAASGKSAFAERTAQLLSANTKGTARNNETLPLVYIATLNPNAGGDTSARIKKHRELRKDKGFITVECHESLCSCILPEKNCVALLEDVGNAVANELFGAKKNNEDKNTVDDSLCEKYAESVLNGIRLISRQCRSLVVVTNEVSSDTVPMHFKSNSKINNDSSELETYMRVLGCVNARWASECTTAVEVVSSEPVFIKGDVY